MQLISAEILEEARTHLSYAVLGTGLLVGLLLWSLGWWGHRFWIVLTATVAGGVIGLRAGPDYHLQPVVAGLLLAVSAGVLALSLVRVFAYAAGGVAAWMIVHALAPLWDQPLLCFLIGGLIGLLLFRFWTMALTSFVGTVLFLYSGLAILDKMEKVDSAGWAQDQGTILNWLCGVTALVGFLVQFILERRRLRKKRDKEEEEEEYERDMRYAHHKGGRRRAG
jgi:MFS family permease